MTQPEHDVTDLVAKCQGCGRICSGKEMREWGFGARWAWGVTSCCDMCSGGKEEEECRD